MEKSDKLDTECCNNTNSKHSDVCRTVDYSPVNVADGK